MNLLDKLESDYENYFGSDEFNEMYYYDGDDLGFTYSKDGTMFKVWSPVASEVTLNLYKEGEGDCLIRKVPMSVATKGVWSVYVEGDLEGTYYTYSISISNLKEMDRENPDNVRYVYSSNGETITNETADVYSVAVGVNGNRSMVVNLENTNPSGWEYDKKPEFDEMTDAVIYELHVRDLSINDSSGVSEKHQGKNDS